MKLEGVVEIPLPGGLVALISECDADLVSRYRWYKLVAGADLIYARAKTRINGKEKTLLMHRVIVGLEFGDPREVDHRDGNGLNNTRGNLRISTRFQNARNRRRTKNKTGFKGVTRDSSGYIAAIGNKSNGYIGHFATAEEAGAAYDRAATEKYGEFAAPNTEMRRDG